jgi:hypothetical protein
MTCQINKGMPLQAWRPEKTEIRLMRFMIMIIKVKLKKRKTTQLFERLSCVNILFLYLF